MNIASFTLIKERTQKTVEGNLNNNLSIFVKIIGNKCQLMLVFVDEIWKNTPHTSSLK